MGSRPHRSASVADRGALECVVHGNECHPGGRVRELESPRNVADCPDTRCGGCQRGRRTDEPAFVTFDPGVLEAEALRERPASDGDEKVLHFEGVLAGNLDTDARTAARDGKCFRAGTNIDTVGDQRFVHDGRRFGFFSCEDSIERFDDGDVSAEAGKGLGELGADCAAAEDEHRCGTVLEVEDVSFVSGVESASPGIGGIAAVPPVAMMMRGA